MAIITINSRPLASRSLSHSLPYPPSSPVCPPPLLNSPLPLFNRQQRRATTTGGGVVSRDEGTEKGGQGRKKEEETLTALRDLPKVSKAGSPSVSLNIHIPRSQRSDKPTVCPL